MQSSSFKKSNSMLRFSGHRHEDSSNTSKILVPRNHLHPSTMLFRLALALCALLQAQAAGLLQQHDAKSLDAQVLGVSLASLLLCGVLPQPSFSIILLTS